MFTFQRTGGVDEAVNGGAPKNLDIPKRIMQELKIAVSTQTKIKVIGPSDPESGSKILQT